MKLASPFFLLARDILAVPAGATEHPGIPADRITGLAARIAVLADTIQGFLPLNTVNLRATADALHSLHRDVGLTPDEARQLAGYISGTGALVALREPEETGQ